MKHTWCVLIILFVKNLISKCCYGKTRKIYEHEEDDFDQDIDNDGLEKKVMTKLRREKQMIRNWHTVLMRI